MDVAPDVLALRAAGLQRLVSQPQLRPSTLTDDAIIQVHQEKKDHLSLKNYENIVFVRILIFTDQSMNVKNIILL